MTRIVTRLTLRARLLLVMLVPLVGMSLFAAIWAMNRQHEARDAGEAKRRTELVVSATRLLYTVNLTGLMVELVRENGGLASIGRFGAIVEEQAATSDDDLRRQVQELESMPTATEADRRSIDRIVHTVAGLREWTQRRPGIPPEVLRGPSFARAQSDAYSRAARAIEQEVLVLRDGGAAEIHAGSSVLFGIMHVQQLALREGAHTMLAGHNPARGNIDRVRDAMTAVSSATKIVGAQLPSAERVKLAELGTSTDGRRWRALQEKVLRHEPISLVAGVIQLNGRMGAIGQIESDYSEALIARSATIAANARRGFQLALAAAIALVLISVALMALVLRPTTRTLKRLEDRARRIAAGELDVAPLDVRGRDETAVLATSFDQMAGTLRTLQAQVEALAEGRSGDPLLQRRVPGRIGASIARSVDRLTTMTSRLRSSEEMARLTVDTAIEAILTLDDRGCIMTANPASAELSGVPVEHLAGLPLSDVMDLGGIDLATGDPPPTLTDQEARFERVDGTIVDVLVSTRTVTGADGTRRTMIFARDISERKRLEQTLEWRASHDALTALPNRLAFDREITRSIDEGDGAVAVLFIDLDRFKRVNDAHGHRMGDELLRQVASRLRENLRREDLLARLGGDEFVVAHRNPGTAEEVEAFAKRLIASLERPFDLHGTYAHVSSSIGVVMSDGLTDAAELVRRADLAMYRAKEAGRGRVAQYDDSMHGWARDRLRMEEALRSALEARALTPYYQPILSMEDGRLESVEMLARWTHPDGTSVSPTQFIPIAEETGLVVEIGKWALEVAAATAVELRQADPTFDAPIAVNISGVHLMHGDLYADVEDALAKAGAEPRWLRIEITESYLIEESVDLVDDALRRLVALGVRLSIDDFGTGYSSLTYLRRLPADEVKVDRTYIAALDDDGGETAIVSLVTTLAHSIGLRVVAEGVETERQRQLLVRAGCDMAQGYLFARPLPLSEFATWLRARGPVVAPV